MILKNFLLFRYKLVYNIKYIEVCDRYLYVFSWLVLVLYICSWYFLILFLIDTMNCLWDWEESLLGTENIREKFGGYLICMLYWYRGRSG